MSETLARVVVASGDGDYRRLAGVALARAGFDVRTVAARLERIERIVEHRGPDVLVLDVSPAGFERLAAFARDLPSPPILVQVRNGTGGAAGSPGKWGPLTDLVDAVTQAAGSRRRPFLHVVR